MLQIRPEVGFSVTCPGCDGRLSVGRLHFAGMPIFAECFCSNCNEQYWVDLPVGHALLHPAIISARTGTTYFAGLRWYPEKVRRIFGLRGTPERFPIRTRNKPPASRSVVIINCLDTLFGHALLKFMSCLELVRRSDLDVAVIIPSKLSWIVPASVHSVLEVDVPLEKSGVWIAGLDAEVEKLLAPYQAAYVAMAASQPDLSSADLTVLGPEFEQKRFWVRNGGELRQVMIVTREDRLWIGGEQLVRAIARRPKLNRRLKPILVRYQNWKFAKVATQLARQEPDLRILVAGLGRTGRFPDHIVDLRQTEITPAVEREWCAEYARSDIVLGVHGSNMLLPSALAGGVVNLLPRYKLRNVTQDLILGAEREPKLCLFRYRILPTTTPWSIVADTITSMLTNAGLHYANIIGNRVADQTRRIDWKHLSGPESAPAEPPSQPANDSFPRLGEKTVTTAFYNQLGQSAPRDEAHRSAIPTGGRWGTQ